MLAGLYANGSGMQPYTWSLARALSGQGHEIVLVDRTGEPIDVLPAGTSTVPVTPPRPRLRRWLGALEGWTVHAQIEQLARELQIDVLHAPHPELGVVSSCPTVVTAHDPLLNPLRRAAAGRRRGAPQLAEVTYGLSDWWCCRQASAVVALTKAVERAVSRKHRCVRWIPPSIPDEDIREATARQSQDCFLAANLLDDPNKGLELAIEAVARARRTVPEMRLVLLGGWADPGRARELPTFCEVRGFVPHQEMIASLREAGCYLFPSLWEEAGMVALEAMAAGVPVVSTPLPALVDVQSRGLVLARSREPDSFAQAITTALEIDAFVFPREWRGSTTGGRLTDLYVSLLSA
jgi:glycosyltransferase involved in cell wall biosynthesis